MTNMTEYFAAIGLFLNANLAAIGLFLNAIGLSFLARQLKIAQRKRREEVYLTLAAKAAEINKYIFEKKGRQRVVDIFFGHDFESEEHAELYWDTRLVHLHHVNYLEMTWELKGSRNDLKDIDKNWQAFATRLVSHLRGNSTDKMPAEYKRAYEDLWSELHGAMPSPTAYVEWLDKNFELKKST